MDAMVSGVKVETVEVDQESASVRTQFDQEKTSPSMAVIATLAEVMEVDPVELKPLQHTIDTEVLDAIVHVGPGRDGDVRVTFTHQGHKVTVTSYGVASIARDTEPTAEKDVCEDGL